LGDELFEFDDVGAEEADAFGGFFGGHRVFVEGEAEGGFVERGFLEVGGRGGGGVELADARSGGAMVRRSQPASSTISPVLRKEAPMTSVL
jgi:hypothetical protein